MESNTPDNKCPTCKGWSWTYNGRTPKCPTCHGTGQALPEAPAKCPDCGGLPGVYPKRRCPVCHVKATQAQPKTDEVREFYDKYGEYDPDSPTGVEAQAELHRLITEAKREAVKAELVALVKVHPDGRWKVIDNRLSELNGEPSLKREDSDNE